ncbi:MAG: outer membrane protein assembly factor BamB family protein, partial [Desulfotomaculales bacterium]
ACAAFLFPFTAFAYDWTEFGGSPERQRFSQELTAPPVIPKWMLQTGASRSQPILIGGRIYHLAGKHLWVLDARAPYGATESRLLIDKVLVSEEPTASHPTWTGKGVYYGTGKHPDGQYRLGYYDPSRPGQYLNVPLTAQVVSAPLVLAGDTVVVATTDGNVHVVRGLSSGEYKHAPFKIGNGRVSSSPAPLGPDSFIIGLDAGNSVKAYKIITGEDGSISLQRIWYLQTETGVPASFAVKGDALYFSDKGGAFYCVNKNTGKIIWHNTDLFSGNLDASFINNSPAVSNTNVYFTMRQKDGGGLLVGLDKDTGRIVLQSRLEGEGNTAPVVWRSAGAVLVADTAGNVYAFAGADGKPFLWTWGWDNRGNPSLGSVINLSEKLYRAPTDWDQLSGAGVELTLASGTMGNEGTLFLAGVNTAETEGYLCAWGTSPLGNIKAVSIDPGVPAGEKAKPGQKYTARVIFKNEYPLDLPDIPVGGYHNQWPATLKDETGQELPKKVIGGKLTYVADFKAGETRTFTFDWHAPEDRATTTLYGDVNNDRTGINWPETNYGDN